MNIFLSSFLAFTALSFSTVLAAPDGGAPHDISPALGTQDDGDSDSSEVGYEESPPATVREEPISRLTSDSYGTLAQGQGGLPDSIWQNDDRATDEFLLNQLRSGIANEAIRNLVIKLLMTGSPPPPGPAGSDWFILRLNALANLGQDSKVMEMIQSVPRSIMTTNILKFQVELELAHGDYDKACKESSPDAHSTDEASTIFWKKLTIACQAHSGKRDEASVGLDVLRETDSGDQFFQEAIVHINDKTIPLHNLPKQISLFDFALIRMGGDTERLKDRIDTIPSIAVKYLAEDVNVETKLREKAAARAQQIGITPVPESNKPPEQPFAKTLASDVSTLVTALGSGNRQAKDSDNAVIARLALDDAGISDSRRVEKLLTLMQLFGYHIPDATWQMLFAHKNRYDGEVPPAVLIDKINQAALANRKAEVILLAGIITDGNEADKVSEIALVPVVKALKMAGFEKEARTVAYDAVKAYH